jgi:hypothetical protein
VLLSLRVKSQTHPDKKPYHNGMNEKLIAELEKQIDELKARFPAHSVPPHMFIQLEDLEEKLAQAKKDQVAGK